MEAREYRIEGIVQGVGFRWSAWQKAMEFGIRGWIANESDGSVSCRTQGEPEALTHFETWLRHGPRGAQVTRCVFKPVAVAEGLDDFVVLRGD